MFQRCKTPNEKKWQRRSFIVLIRVLHSADEMPGANIGQDVSNSFGCQGDIIIPLLIDLLRLGERSFIVEMAVLANWPTALFDGQIDV